MAQSPGVALSIDLDDQLGLHASEVGDEMADRNLSTEFETCQSAISQNLPESFFGEGHVAAQWAGAVEMLRLVTVSGHC